MVFQIQASSPCARRHCVAQEENLREAIEDIFPQDTEDAFINWNGSYFPLSYKYDWPVIIEDVQRMLGALIESEDSKHTVNWPSNTFNATWNLSWSRGVLDCKADWVSVTGSIEEQLAQSGGIQITVSKFVAEWKQPLQRITSALGRIGYRTASLPGLDHLQALVGQIEEAGQLYGEVDDYD